MDARRWKVHHTIATGVLVALVAGGARRSAADAPAGRYTIANGTVSDTQTGLVWQQAAPTNLTWSNANAYCANNTPGLPGTGWRLPSMGELQTIVDESLLGPAIDPTAFPNTTNGAFWTSSSVAGQAGSAWVVDGNDGNNGIVPMSTGEAVRCVR